MMKVEDLLNLLHEQGLDDEAVKALLSDALASLDGPAEEEMDEKEKASELLGVAL